MADSAAALARRIAEMGRKVDSLARASQISRSTVAIDGADIAVPEAIGEGVRAGVEVGQVREALEQARVDLDAAMEALGENLEQAEQLIAGAESRLSDAESQITDAFGQIATVQDEANAASAVASAAITSADAAITSASAAQSTADNLPKVLHGTTAASGTAPDGSIWFQHDGSLSGNVIGQWNRVAGAWVATPIDSEAIANLDVGKLTAGSAAISELVAQQIAASSGQFIALDVGQLIASEAVMDEAVANKIWADSTVTRLLTAEDIIAGSAIIDGTVTAAQFVAEVMNGQTIRGAYVEAPIIASSPNLGAGANALNDPDLVGAVGDSWVASGWLGDPTPAKQTTRFTWDQTRPYSPGTCRMRGDISLTTSAFGVDRRTGSVLMTHTSAIYSTANTTVNNPYTYTSQTVGGMSPYFDTIWGELPVLAAAAPTQKTTYLTNTAVIPIAEGETWNASIAHSGLNADTAAHVVDARLQLVRADNAQVVWERALVKGELANGTPIAASFIAPITTSVRFRIAATYTAAGGGINRRLEAGSWHRADMVTGSATFLPWYKSYSGEQVPPYTPPQTYEPSAPIARGHWLAYSSEKQAAARAATWDRANTSWRITRAQFSQVQPEKGYRLDNDKGLQLFNENGARTGQLNGVDNFLAGTFATADSGQRVQMDTQRVAWFNAFGTVVESLVAADVHALKGTLDDTGWINITGYTSGFTGSVQYRIRGGVVYWRGTVNGNIPTGTYTTVATGLPLEAIPDTTVRFSGGGSGATPTFFELAAAGTLVVAHSRGSVMPWAGFATSFPQV